MRNSEDKAEADSNAVKMPPRRGRPAFRDPVLIRNVAEKYKDQIFLANRKIAPRSFPIWSTLEKETKYSASSLYSYVTSNEKNIRADFEPVQIIRNFNESTVDSSALEDSATANDHYISDFEIQFTRDEFQALLIKKVIREKVPGRAKPKLKQRTVFKKFDWELPMDTKIYEATKISCGFRYRSHQIKPTLNTGMWYFVIKYCNNFTSFANFLQVFFWQIVLAVRLWSATLKISINPLCGLLAILLKERVC